MSRCHALNPFPNPSGPPHAPPPSHVLSLQNTAAKIVSSEDRAREGAAAAEQTPDSAPKALKAPVRGGREERSSAGRKAAKVGGSAGRSTPEKAARGTGRSNHTENNGIRSEERGKAADPVNRVAPGKAAGAGDSSDIAERKGEEKKGRGKVMGGTAGPHPGSASDALGLLTKDLPPRRRAEITEFVSEAKEYYHAIDEEELEEED